MQQQLDRVIRMAGANRDHALLAKITGDPGVGLHLQAAGEALLSALVGVASGR